MPMLALNRQSLSQLKASVHAQLPHIKSSHLAEALATAVGFQTHAALLALIATPAGRNQTRTPDASLFLGRLRRFGYEVNPDFHFDVLEQAAAIPAPARAPYAHEVAEPALFNKPYAERCWNYGVRIESEAPGKVWAAHNVAGRLGPFETEEQAAREACAVWNL